MAQQGAERLSSLRRVFVYEFITAGGTLNKPEFGHPHGSLPREGAAMLRAVARDFARLPEVQVVVMRDKRLQDLDLAGVEIRPAESAEHERELFMRLAADSWATLIIAPEFEGILSERVRLAEEAGATLISPGRELVGVATDKTETARLLRAAGVPVPEGISIAPGESLPSHFPYPAVAKPNDGAGSQDICLLPNAARARALEPVTRSLRLEKYCAGVAASAACLCGSAGIFPLPPCRQLLAADGSFAYLGGALLTDEQSCGRAQGLALSAIAALPPAVGYIGVDLVLGDRADGSDDYVIEVNPRVTTSYVGLRAVAQTNLAEAMLSVAAGEVPQVTCATRPFRFDADGRLHFEP